MSKFVELTQLQGTQKEKETLTYLNVSTILHVITTDRKRTRIYLVCPLATANQPYFIEVQEDYETVKKLIG